MIDNRPSKRRLSDADKNERIAMRQMVLNMSMCKLQKRNGRKEPSLCRTVVINNTVQQIEQEMDNELIAEYEKKNHFDSQMNMHVDEYFSAAAYNLDQSDSHQLHNQSVSNDAQVTTYTFNNTPNRKYDADRKKNKFGAIGDHRNKNVTSENENLQMQNGFLSGFMWDNLSLPSFVNNNINNPVLDSVEIGSNFTDVDISLYDFDNAHRNSFSRSCASEYDRRQPDPFFQELDHIMQVLVGM